MPSHSTVDRIPISSVVGFFSFFLPTGVSTLLTCGRPQIDSCQRAGGDFSHRTASDIDKNKCIVNLIKIISNNMDLT